MKAVRWILDPDTGCLDWALYVAPDGYGRQTKDGRAGYPHRFAYEDAYGPIPEGHYLRQICGNRRCGNLEHLQPVPEFPNSAMRATLAATKRTEENCSLAEQLRASGKSYKEIGKVIGVEASTVRKWLKGSYAAALNVRLVKPRD
jgi:HNH endonuclease